MYISRRENTHEVEMTNYLITYQALNYKFTPKESYVERKANRNGEKDLIKKIDSIIDGVKIRNRSHATEYLIEQ